MNENLFTNKTTFNNKNLAVSFLLCQKYISFDLYSNLEFILLVYLTSFKLLIDSSDKIYIFLVFFVLHFKPSSAVWGRERQNMGKRVNTKEN